MSGAAFLTDGASMRRQLCVIALPGIVSVLLVLEPGVSLAAPSRDPARFVGWGVAESPFEVGLMGVDNVVENSDLLNVLNARFTRK